MANRVIRAKHIDPNDPTYDPAVAVQHAKEPVHGERAETAFALRVQRFVASDCLIDWLRAGL
eukprot:2555211-Alexandrium_andersonii.AAC.1